jgi:myo-inositol-1(or 4)-monophosphatase
MSEPRRANPDEQIPMSEPKGQTQLLHLVIGGELKTLQHNEFKDLSAVDFVGAFPNYKTAYDAWKAAAQRTVDNAHTRYFIIHAHRLLDPETDDHED